MAETQKRTLAVGISWDKLGMRHCMSCGLVCGCTEKHDKCKSCGTPFDEIGHDLGGEG